MKCQAQTPACAPLNSTVSLHELPQLSHQNSGVTMFRTTAILILTCLSGVALGREFMGHKVIDAPFVVAGGKTVVLPITDAGPIPAEDRKAKIEAAGFIITRSSDDPKLALIIWTFG